MRNDTLIQKVSMTHTHCFKQPLSESATSLSVSVSDRVSAPDRKTDHFDEVLMLTSEN